MKNKFKGVAIDPNFNTKELHQELQRLRKAAATDGADITLKSYLQDIDKDLTPEKFYSQLGVDLSTMTVEKMLNTSELNRWLFPEVVRDAVLTGLSYTPFYGALTAAEENIPSTGITMPSMDFSAIDVASETRLRDTNEGATITEGQIITWGEKTVNIKKKARGLKQTYESIMFCPIDLAAIYFQEMGTQLGADLDTDLINIAFNGDQLDGSQSSPVIGASTANTLTYQDLVRAWVRFSRLNRTSTAMVVSENDAATILNMAQFQNTVYPGAVSPASLGGGPTLNIRQPLPQTQDVFPHDSIPDGKIIFVDKARAFVQLTAMPLLLESEKLVSRQIQGEYASIITGFANLFRDGRMVLDYTTSLSTNPGPAVPIR